MAGDFSYKKVKKESEDIEKAMKEYESHTKKQMDKGDVSLPGAYKTRVYRNNLLDKLDKDLQNAGRSKTDRDIWGE